MSDVFLTPKPNVLVLSIDREQHAHDYRFVRGNEMACWTLEYLPVGQVAVRSSKGEHVYESGSLMLIPPLTPYAVEWAGGEGEWEEMYVIFDPPASWNPLLVWPTSNCGLGILQIPNSAIAQEVDAALTTAIQLQKSARTNRQALLFNALERALITIDEINPKRGNKQRDERIENVLSHIALHYAEPLDLAILSREVFLSPSRFSHLFREQMQQAPMQYLEQYRLERAAEKLLSGQDSIEHIAQNVGFINAFHFSTRFRSHFGCSPSRYRRSPK